MIDHLVSKGVLPDGVLRKGIQHFIGQRIKEDIGTTVAQMDQKRSEFIEQMRKNPIAIMTTDANDQHYRLPTSFFEQVLGNKMKYSCCHWNKATNLDESEEEMLELTIKRADIKDGHKILELGCGWGAITLTMAKKFPNSEIIAISNSPEQREYILNKAKAQKLNNVEVRTHNVAELNLEEKFDRVISVEMFEHMRNYPLLLERIHSWLNPEGKLFVHIFVHRDVPYNFDIKDDSDWMSKYFFSGGIMPSSHLLHYFQDHLKMENYWAVDGVHYQKTARAWLEKMDKNKKPVMKILDEHYGKKESKKWFNYWRVFFMSCEELWKYRNGTEWFVGHYLLRK